MSTPEIVVILNICINDSVACILCQLRSANGFRSAWSMDKEVISPGLLCFHLETGHQYNCTESASYEKTDIRVCVTGILFMD